MEVWIVYSPAGLTNLEAFSTREKGQAYKELLDRDGIPCFLEVRTVNAATPEPELKI